MKVYNALIEVSCVGMIDHQVVAVLVRCISVLSACSNMLAKSVSVLPVFSNVAVMEWCASVIPTCSTVLEACISKLPGGSNMLVVYSVALVCSLLETVICLYNVNQSIIIIQA